MGHRDAPGWGVAHAWAVTRLRPLPPVLAGASAHFDALHLSISLHLPATCPPRYNRQLSTSLQPAASRQNLGLASRCVTVLATLRFVSNIRAPGGCTKRPQRSCWRPVSRRSGAAAEPAARLAINDSWCGCEGCVAAWRPAARGTSGLCWVLPRVLPSVQSQPAGGRWRAPMRPGATTAQSSTAAGPGVSDRG